MTRLSFVLTVAFKLEKKKDFIWEEEEEEEEEFWNDRVGGVSHSA